MLRSTVFVVKKLVLYIYYRLWIQLDNSLVIKVFIDFAYSLW